MSNQIVVKKSSVAGKSPLATDLLTGELAANLTDRYIFSKDGNGNVFKFNAGNADSVANTLTRGSYLTGSNFNGSSATTWAVDATPLNTAGKVVARDSNGDFAVGVVDVEGLKLGHLYQEKAWRIGGGTDLEWKVLADVTIGTGLYAAATVDIEVRNLIGNHGQSPNIEKYQYYATMYRSAGVQDDKDNATVSGPHADYVRVVKTALGVYQVQVRTNTSYRNIELIARISQASLGTGGSFVYGNCTVSGATTGTIYTAGRTYSTESFTNIYASGVIKAYGSDTAALPSYTWDGDTNTGIYHYAEDAIGFSTNGTARALVNSTGVYGVRLGVWNNGNNNGAGISLYNGPTSGMPSYGLMFQGTSTFGTHGAVTSDWATYFTMAGSTSRGWIFKAVGSTSSAGNVASISATGVMTANSFVGNGSSLTDLDASKLASGIVPDARLSGTYTGVSVSGNAGTATTVQQCFETNNTTSTNLSQYSKIATITINSQYNDIDLNLRVMATNSGHGVSRYCDLVVRVKQQAAFGSDPGIELVDYAERGSDFAFGYVIVSNAGPTVVDIYAYSSSSYTVLRGYLTNLAANAGTVDFFTKSAFEATVPTGLVSSTSVVRYNSANLTKSTIGLGNVPNVDATNASNLASGTVPSGRLTGSYGISVTGNAATATKLATARLINNQPFDGTSDITITAEAVVSNDVAGISVAPADKDPNTCVERTFLTNHANGPGLSIYWHVTNFFWEDNTTANNRAQIAVSYNNSVTSKDYPLLAVRHCYAGTWSRWDVTNYVRDVDWNTAAGDGHAGFTSGGSSSPMGEGTNIVGLTVPMQVNPDYSFQMGARSNRLFFRSKEGTNLMPWREALAKDNGLHLSDEKTLVVSTAGWVTIANCPSGRAYGEFLIYDADSARHNLVKLIATASYGLNTIEVQHGTRFSTRTVAHVRILYQSADRTYGGAKLQIYCENPTFTLRVRSTLTSQVAGWTAWDTITPVFEAPSGWVEDPATRIDDISHPLSNKGIPATRINWEIKEAVGQVVGQLVWRNYGNAHTIFDASKSLTPTGAACDNSKPTYPWSAGYPTLMGYNGTATYGVKVNKADHADEATASQTALRTNMYGSTANCNNQFTETPAGQRTFQEGNNMANAPTTSWGFVESIRHTNAGGYWGIQYFHSWENLQYRRFMRNVSSGTFGGWVEDTNQSNFKYHSSAVPAADIGAYSFLQNQTGSTLGVGTTTAGSNLRYSSHNGATTTAPPGTWRSMGICNHTGVAVFLRIM